MSKYLNLMVAWIARAHDFILTLNDNYDTNFSDKQLHFLVIGAVGLGLYLIHRKYGEPYHFFMDTMPAMFCVGALTPLLAAVFLMGRA